MQSEVRNLNADLDSLREQFEEEQESKAEVQRQLSKAHNEVQMWRSKCESGGGASSEAVEELRYADSTELKTPNNISKIQVWTTSKMFYLFFYRRRMQTKLNETEQNLEAASVKISQLEKVKIRMGQEMEDLVIEVERVRFTFKLKFLKCSFKC